MPFWIASVFSVPKKKNLAMTRYVSSLRGTKQSRKSVLQQISITDSSSQPLFVSYCAFVQIVLISLFLMSCQSYRLVGIETINPAAITFPPDIKKVMIVNNSAQQPDGFGYTVAKFQEETIPVSADSMAHHFCVALGKAIAESIGYFKAVCDYA